MTKPVRRIVTGHDEAGRSVILMDGPAPNVFSSPLFPQLVSQLLWVTDGVPASNRGNEDTAPAARKVAIEPPSRGTLFRIADIPPDTALQGVDVGQLMEVIGSGKALDKGRPRHPFFHKTATVDYAIVLEGEIWAMLDEGEVLMKQGDVLIQRGTNHSWSNRTDKPCRMAFILIDAEPVGELH
jgi:mannose-6-phosphate isomerase-like protein (cupin superfamily)